ncbi:MAG: hypothetical protein QE280_04710 [Caulobacter sp.]|jgi:hypothetical protein|nr:hypothetical protein [Caulobacter sp.]
MPMILAASASLLLLAGAAQSGDASPAAPPAPAVSTPPAPAKPGIDDPNRLICKREHVVGSNRPQKICMTAAERQRLKDKADDFLDPTRSTPGEADALRSSQGGIGG